MSDRPQKQQYRYPGATPFSTDQSHIFFGRDQETKQLLKLIMRQPLAVLYGKSGLGKSSLINAGIIPQVKKTAYYSPLLVRFGAWTPDSQSSPLDITKEVLREYQEASSLLTELIPHDNSLWLHAKNRQLTGRGRPLIIFDQFEELFSYPEVEVAAFQEEIAELLHTGIPLRFRRRLDTWGDLAEEEEDRLEAPLETRVLFAIRSDRLHLLDRLKDYLPNILRHTFELQAFAPEEARAAITLPAKITGPFLSVPFEFSEAALEKLLSFLQDQETGRVEGILIQMLCEHYEREQVEQLGHTMLDLPQIGNPEDVVSNYYREKIRSLPPARQSTARLLIEEGLVSEGDKMRLILHESSIKTNYKVPQKLLDELVESRLLRSEPFIRGGYTYELSHDRLVKAVLTARTQRRAEEEEEARLQEALLLREQAEKERKEKEKAKKQLRQTRGLLIFAVLALLAAVTGLGFALDQQNRAKKSEQEAIRNAELAEENRGIAERNASTALENERKAIEKEREASQLLKENIRKDSLTRLANFRQFRAEAQSLQEQAKYEEAIARYRAAKKFTNNPHPIDQAIADCEVAAKNFERFNTLIKKANVAIAKDDFSAAIRHFHDISFLGVNQEEVLLRLNYLLNELNEEARKAQENADAYTHVDEEISTKYQDRAYLLNMYILELEQTRRIKQLYEKKN